MLIRTHPLRPPSESKPRQVRALAAPPPLDRGAPARIGPSGVIHIEEDVIARYMSLVDRDGGFDQPGAPPTPTGQEVIRTTTTPASSIGVRQTAAPPPLHTPRDAAARRRAAAVPPTPRAANVVAPSPPPSPIVPPTPRIEAMRSAPTDARSRATSGRDDIRPFEPRPWADGAALVAAIALVIASVAAGLWRHRRRRPSV